MADKKYKDLTQRLDEHSISRDIAKADPNEAATRDDVLKMWSVVNPDLSLNLEDLVSSAVVSAKASSLKQDTYSKTLKYVSEDPEHSQEAFDYPFDSLKSPIELIDVLADVYQNEKIQKIRDPEKQSKAISELDEIERLLIQYTNLKHVLDSAEVGDQKGIELCRNQVRNYVAQQSQATGRSAYKEFSAIILRDDKKVIGYCNELLNSIKQNIVRYFTKTEKITKGKEKGKEKKIFNKEALKEYTAGIIEREYDEKLKPIVYTNMALRGHGIDIHKEEAEYVRNLAKRGYQPTPRFQLK